MDNKRIDMYERRFKDHVATVKQLDEETQVLKTRFNYVVY